MEALWDNRGAYCTWLAYNLKLTQVLKAGVAGAVVVTNMFLNRETNDGLSPAEKSYLHETFQYTGGGLVLTALAARTMFKNGFAFRIMSANPCKLPAISPSPL